jgi:hypothetical protein
MSSYVVGALIGGGTTVLGFALSAVREGRIRKEASREASRAELKLAMREYLASLDQIVRERVFYPADVDHMPVWVRWTERLPLERVLRGSVIEYAAIIILRMIQRAAYGPRLDEVTDRLTAASTHLRLIGTPRVYEGMEEASELLATYADDAEWKAKWGALRASLRQRFRIELE